MAQSIDALVSTAYFKAFSIKERINTFFLQHYPSDKPIELLIFYKDLCTEYQSRLKKVYSEYDDAPDDVLREVKLISQLLCEIASHIRFAEGASTDKTQLGFVCSLEKFVKSLLPEANLILRPQWQYNYKILDLIRDYRKAISTSLSSEKFNTLTSNIGDSLYIVSFPGLERDNIFALTKLGHEIGHPFADLFFDQESKIYMSEIEEEVEKIPRSSVSDYASMIRDKTRLIDNIVEIRKRGLGEIIADLVSVSIFGLGSLFAAHSFVIEHQDIDTFYLSDPNRQFYPPWRMRLRAMYNHLIGESIYEFLEEYKPQGELALKIKETATGALDEIKSTISQTEDENNLNQRDETRIAYNLIKKALEEKVNEYLKASLPMYDLKSSYSNLMHLCERLHNRIPPNAVESNGSTHAVNLQSILVAGWLYKVSELSPVFSDGNPENDVKKLHTINKLIFKAIELSEIQREYTNNA